MTIMETMISKSQEKRRRRNAAKLRAISLTKPLSQDPKQIRARDRWAIIRGKVNAERALIRQLGRAALNAMKTARPED